MSYLDRIYWIGAFLTLLVQVGWWISDPEGYGKRFSDPGICDRIQMLLILCLLLWPAIWLCEAIVMLDVLPRKTS